MSDVRSAETVPCPYCSGSGQVKRTRAVDPWKTHQDRDALARVAKPGDRWVRIKNGRVAVIEAPFGTRNHGCVVLRHQNGMSTSKWVSYFASEFTPETPPT